MKYCGMHSNLTSHAIVSQLGKCLKFKSIRGDKNDCTLYQITPRNAINFGHLSSCGAKGIEFNSLQYIYSKGRFIRSNFFIQLSPCINYMQYPWGYALPLSHIISTRESYPQYSWGYASPVSHIISTRESYPQYPWVISSVPVSHILSTHEDMQYPWGYALPVREVSFVLHSYKFIHGYCISSRVLKMTYGYWWYDSWVLHILMGTEDMTHGYWGYDSRVLHILTGTEDMTHGYWWYDSRVLHILIGTEDMTQGYWGYDSRVLHILTGTEDMTHGYWWYDSQVMHILTGTAYPHGYSI